MVRPIKYLVDTLLLCGYPLPHNTNNLDEILNRKFEDCPELVEACSKFVFTSQPIFIEFLRFKIPESPLNAYLEEGALADMMWVVHFDEYLSEVDLDEDWLNDQLKNYWRFQVHENHNPILLFIMIFSIWRVKDIITQLHIWPLLLV